MANMLHPADSVMAALLITVNVVLGLCFALCRGPRMNTTRELFLGSRSLQAFPLALSTMASSISGIGIIGFTAHYYMYGIHMIWVGVPMLLTAPFLTNIVLPALYKLHVTSLFEVGPEKYVEN